MVAPGVRTAWLAAKAKLPPPAARIGRPGTALLPRGWVGGIVALSALVTAATPADCWSGTGRTSITDTWLLLAATEPPPLLLAELLHSEVMIVVIVDAPVAAEAGTAEGTVGNCPAALAVIVVVAACGLSGL